MRSRQGDRPCVGDLLFAAAAFQGDDEVATIALQFLGQAPFDGEPRDLAWLGAANYLLHKPGAKALRDSARELAIQRLREVARESQVRDTAIGVLSPLRSDDDIPLMQTAISAGSELEMVKALFALSDNCSQNAVSALRASLSSSRVESYLSRYRGKESLTRTIEQNCSIALKTSG